MTSIEIIRPSQILETAKAIDPSAAYYTAVIAPEFRQGDELLHVRRRFGSAQELVARHVAAILDACAALGIEAKVTRETSATDEDYEAWAIVACR